MSNLQAEYTQPAGTYDNHARDYHHITARPLSSSIGAEIIGADLLNGSDAQLVEIKDALYHHKMVYFRRQELSLEDQEQITLRFGNFGVDAYTSGIPNHPNVQRVVKEASDQVAMIFGGSWHTDSPFLEQPPGISILYGKDIPPYGGDTWWANSQIAYETLSPAYQALIADLKVHMSGRRVLAGLKKHSPATADVAVASMDIDVKERTLVDGAVHPMVRTHPATGTKSLYVCPTYAVGIVGMSTYESAPILDFLCAHVNQPLFTCRLRWEPNTLAMWDNRTTMHHAFNDHDGYRREMLRTIVEGEVPF